MSYTRYKTLRGKGETQDGAQKKLEIGFLQSVAWEARLSEEAKHPSVFSGDK